MKKQRLEILLQRLKGHPHPSANLEQYATPALIAADVLWFAYTMGDIADRKVVDLGCGTGILGIGAKLLGAQEVIAVDIDEAALDVARQNAEGLGVDLSFVAMDVKDFPKTADTVLMNPPFGAQNPHADIPFLERAVALAPVAYTFHLAETEAFVLDKVREFAGVATHRKVYEFPLPHSMPFHTEEVRRIPAVLFRLIRRLDEPSSDVREQKYKSK